MNRSIPSPPLRVTDEGGQTTVCFAELPALTEDNVTAVGDALTALIESRDRQDYVFDLAAVGFLTSIVLSKFITLNGRVRARGGRLTLVNLRPTIRKVFTISRLDSVLNIRDTDEVQAA